MVAKCKPCNYTKRIALTNPKDKPQRKDQDEDNASDPAPPNVEFEIYANAIDPDAADADHGDIDALEMAEAFSALGISHGGLAVPGPHRRWISGCFILILQHWFVLLKYVNEWTYCFVELMLELWFQWTVSARISTPCMALRPRRKAIVQGPDQGEACGRQTDAGHPVGHDSKRLCSLRAKRGCRHAS